MGRKKEGDSVESSCGFMHKLFLLHPWMLGWTFSSQTQPCDVFFPYVIIKFKKKRRQFCFCLFYFRILTFLYNCIDTHQVDKIKCVKRKKKSIPIFEILKPFH